MPPPHPGDDATRTILLRLQSAAAAAARALGEAVDAPPFVAMFHPTDPLIYLNQALPDGSQTESSVDVEAAVERLRAEFRRRERHPRFEFSEDLWPDLPSILERHGLRRQGAVPIMICTAAELRPFRSDGVTVEWVAPQADEAWIREVLTAQRGAFEPGRAEATDAEVLEVLSQLRSGTLRLAAGLVDGRVAGAGALVGGGGEVAELAGVGTAEHFRGRGVARAVSLFLARAHLGAGGSVVWLGAGDDTARRVYERIGFRTIGRQLHYIDAAWSG